MILGKIMQTVVGSNSPNWDRSFGEMLRNRFQSLLLNVFIRPLRFGAKRLLTIARRAAAEFLIPAIFAAFIVEKNPHANIGGDGCFRGSFHSADVVMRVSIDRNDQLFLEQLHRLCGGTVQEICDNVGVTATAVRQRL